MKFIATDYRKDGAYSVHFDAESIQHAEKLCTDAGMTFAGVLGAVVYDEELAVALADTLSNLQNKPTITQ